MTKQRWLLVGAIVVGFAVMLYFVFFCPSTCH